MGHKAKSVQQIWYWASNPTLSLSINQLRSIFLCLHAALPHPHFYHHWRSHPPSLYTDMGSCRKTSEGDQSQKNPGSWWHQLLNPPGLWVSGSLLNPQPESKAGKISCLVGNLLCSSCSQIFMSQGAQPLQACDLTLSPDGDIEAPLRPCEPKLDLLKFASRHQGRWCQSTLRCSVWSYREHISVSDQNTQTMW